MSHPLPDAARQAGRVEAREARHDGAACRRHSASPPLLRPLTLTHAVLYRLGATVSGGSAGYIAVFASPRGDASPEGCPLWVPFARLVSIIALPLADQIAW